MNVCPAEASRLAGVSRKTLYQDMSKGHLSYDVTDKKKRLIQVAELERVYGHTKSNTQKTNGNSKKWLETEPGNSNDPAEIQVLKDKLDALQAERDREREQLTDQIEHLREMVKSEQEERRKFTALLTDQRKEKEGRAGEQDKKMQDLDTTIEELRKQNRRILHEIKTEQSKGIWQRLFG